MKRLRITLSVALYLLIGCLMVFISGCAGANSAGIKKIPTREGITVDLKTYEPKNMTEVKGIILVLGGGGGQIKMYPFLGIMIDKFIEQGYVVEHMGLPSNMWDMPVVFRYSFEHQFDIEKVINHLKGKYPQKPLYILGYSNGGSSVSWYHVPHDNVTDSDIAGIIIMGFGWQWAFDRNMINNFTEMPYSVLQVLHEGDCYGATINKLSSTLKYYDMLEVKGRKGLILINGGSSYMGNACTGAHMFIDRERQVSEAVADWVIGKNGADAKEFKKTIY